MFSEALLELDRNTERFMVEEAKKELEIKKKELDFTKRELDLTYREIDVTKREINVTNIELEAARKKIAQLEQVLQDAGINTDLI